MTFCLFDVTKLTLLLTLLDLQLSASPALPVPSLLFWRGNLYLFLFIPPYIMTTASWLCLRRVVQLSYEIDTAIEFFVPADDRNASARPTFLGPLAVDRD